VARFLFPKLAPPPLPFASRLAAVRKLAQGWPRAFRPPPLSSRHTQGAGSGRSNATYRSQIPHWAQTGPRPGNEGLPAPGRCAPCLRQQIRVLVRLKVSTALRPAWRRKAAGRLPGTAVSASSGASPRAAAAQPAPKESALGFPRSPPSLGAGQQRDLNHIA